MYKSVYVPRLTSAKSTPRVFDTSIVADYAINEAGHIRSDFAVLNEVNDDISRARLLQRVEEYANQDINKGKTFEQIMAEIRPRMCETPGEMDRFEQYCIDKALDFYNKLKDNDVAKLSTGSSPDNNAKPADAGVDAGVDSASN